MVAVARTGVSVKVAGAIAGAAAGGSAATAGSTDAVTATGATGSASASSGSAGSSSSVARPAPRAVDAVGADLPWRIIEIATQVSTTANRPARTCSSRANASSPPASAPHRGEQLEHHAQPQVRDVAAEVHAGAGARGDDHRDERDRDRLAQRQPEREREQRDEEQPAAEPEQRPEQARRPRRRRRGPARPSPGGHDAAAPGLARRRGAVTGSGAEVLRRVREQRHVARALERDGELALVRGARAGLPARLDLGALGEVAAEAVDLLVVDHDRLVGAEGADLPPPAVAVVVVALLRLWGASGSPGVAAERVRLAARGRGKGQSVRVRTAGRRGRRRRRRTGGSAGRGRRHRRHRRRQRHRRRLRRHPRPRRSRRTGR